MNQKFLAIAAISSLLFQSCFFPIIDVFAASDISVTAVKNDAGTIPSGGSILMDPDTSAPSTQRAMIFDVQGRNTTGESIKNVFVNVNFGNNAGFAYDGVNLKSRINSIDVTNPLPGSIYSSSNGIVAELTSPGTLNADVNQSLRLGPVGFSPNISILPSISTYQNTVTTTITALTTAGSTPVTSPVHTFTIYANVKPHVTSVYFEKWDGSNTTTQIQWASAEAINFVAKVRDSNGAANIAGGTVIADLSSIGLSTTEALTYISSSGNVATFKKTGIVTNAPLGAKTIAISGVVATDMDGNINDRNDSNFWSIDQKTDLTLTVVTPAAPNATLVSVSDTQIGGTLEQTSVVVFKSSQNGETKVVIWGDSMCSSGGTILQDWSGSGSYTADTDQTITINASSLASGGNTINLCARNSAQVVGSISTTITKSTTLPILSGLVYSPSSVTTGNASTTFACDADGEARVEQGWSGYGSGTFVSSGSIIALGTQTFTIQNTLFSNGANVFKAYCRDTYGNVSAGSSITINKTPPTPAMTGAISFSDPDADIDGLDGRDVSITWDTSAWVGFGSYFESYRIYILPSGTSYSTWQTSIGIVPRAGSGTFLGAISLTKDSLGNTFVSWAQYSACVAIMGTSGLLGTPVCSSLATLTADIVSHPTIVSARFTSDTNLEITTNATLDTNLATHSGALFSYTIGGNSHTPTAVSSVNAKKIVLTVPSLGSASATGTLVTVSTGALHAAGGGYNNLENLSMAITDGQSPIISGFTKNTAAIFGNYHKGNVTFGYSFNEAMTTDGSTKIDFIRTGGNADATTHTISLTLSTETSAGAKTKTIDLDTLQLVSGTIYQVRISWKDIAGNSSVSETISNVAYDATGPATPSLSSATTLFWTLTPDLAWTIAGDDSGNGSGIKSYLLQIFSGSTCAASPIQSYTSISPSAVSFVLGTALPTDKTNYSWNLRANDNLGNTGSTSTCGVFAVDTSIPTISNLVLKDTVLNSSSWAKIGNSGSVTATIPNTDSAHLWIDLSLLTGNAGDSHVSCAAPTAGITCNYTGNVVSYGFTFGSVTQNTVRIIAIEAQNTVGLNGTSSNASITVDSTPPTVASNTLTSPNGGEIWGGTTRTLTWNPSAISDAGGIADVWLAYSTDSGSNWIPLSSVPNTGSYAWNISSLTSGTNYLIRLTAIDNAGNTATDVSDATFSIDLSAPNVPGNTITFPNGGEVVAGNSWATITWNTGAITDSVSLAANPITLEYSLDNGSSWTLIGSGIANNGTHVWNVWNFNTVQAKIRITVADNAGNTASDTSDTSFKIDSTKPSLGITYAWGGGATPQNGRKLSDSGIDLTMGATDAHLATVSYLFENTSDGLYYNASTQSWGTLVSNVLCTDPVVGGTAFDCSNISTSIHPQILDTKNYTLIIRALDEAGNMTSSITHYYLGDTAAPALTVTHSDIEGYFSGSLVISGTTTDTGSSVASTTVLIQKWSLYWDGTNWGATPTQLLTTTSDNFAQYSYTFTPPLSDGDGAVYSVTASASDNTYRVANVANLNFTSTLDITGPSIASDVFTFDTSKLYRGGDTINVTWDTAKITSSGASLAASPITISVNYGTGVVTLANNLANNGTYSFSLPAIDSVWTRVIITATDVLGNISTATPSSSFIIDSLPPTIGKIETADFDANGAIDGLIVTTSEYVQPSGLSASDWSVNLGGNSVVLSTSIQAANVGSGSQIELRFASNTGNTASLPLVSYNGSSVKDIAGNLLGTVSNHASLDAAVPRIMSAGTKDTNQNGRIDQIDVVWSEPMMASTDMAAWTVSSLLPGLSVASVSTSNNTTSLHLTESSVYDTSSAGTSIGFVSNSSWKDVALNQAGSLWSALSTLDQAAPQVIRISTSDANNNGKIDAIVANFSETVSGNDAGFILSGLSTGSSYLGGATASGNSITFPVSETSDSNDSGNTPSLAYTPGNIVDSASLPLAAFAARSSLDGVAPIILSRTTLDQDGNGKIDTIRVTTSETLSGNTSAITASVAGYALTGSLSLSGSSIIIPVDERSSQDTGNTPDIQITTNSSVTDTAGNVLRAESGATSSQDGSGPVIVLARYDFGASASVSDDVIFVSFSEPIDTSSLSMNDFMVHAGGSLTGATLSNIASTSAEIHLASGSTALIPGTSTLSLGSASVLDNSAAKNSSPNEQANNRVIVLPSLIINEVMWSNSGSSASQYIELRNLGNSSIDVGNWTLENAGGNGVTLTIPGGTVVPAQGFLTISKFAPGTNGSLLSGSIPTIPNAALNLPSTGIIVTLKSSLGITFDRTPTGSWAAGQENPIISMERNLIPWDGSASSSWHNAVVNDSFTDASVRGTPNKANVEDATPPVITVGTASDSIIATLASVQGFSVTDNIAPDYSTASGTLERWNGSAWVQTGSINLAITGTGIDANIAAPSYGKYRTSVSIADYSGNIWNASVVFYVDMPSVDVSTGTVSLGTLNNALLTSSAPITVTVRTIGAATTLDLLGSGALQNGSSVIAAWDGTIGYGADAAQTTGSGSHGYSGISTIPKNLLSIPASPNTNGDLSVYTFQIRYGARPTAATPAGTYQATSNVRIGLGY